MCGILNLQSEIVSKQCKSSTELTEKRVGEISELYANHKDRQQTKPDPETVADAVQAGK